MASRVRLWIQAAPVAYEGAPTLMAVTEILFLLNQRENGLRLCASICCQKYLDHFRARTGELTSKPGFAEAPHRPLNRRSAEDIT